MNRKEKEGFKREEEEEKGRTLQKRAGPRKSISFLVVAETMTEKSDPATTEERGGYIRPACQCEQRRLTSCVQLRSLRLLLLLPRHHRRRTPEPTSDLVPWLKLLRAVHCELGLARVRTVPRRAADFDRA